MLLSVRVIFMNFKRLKEDILAKYPYRIELHAHSNPASACSDVSPEELVEIYHKAGFHALALTNHFLQPLTERGGINAFLEDYERAALYAQQYGMRVYLCAELRFTECMNDYLLYGVDREILERAAHCFERGLTTFVREVKDERSLLIQAHPFRKNIEPVDPALLEGIEVFNLHSGHNSRPATSLQYAVKNGKNIITAGTDFHHPSSQSPIAAMRTAYLPTDSFELAKMLRQGDYFFELENQAIILP